MIEAMEVVFWLIKHVYLFLTHPVFTISQLWFTSHLRNTMVLLDTETPGTSTEIYSEDANDGTRTRNPSVVNRVF